MNAIDFGAVQRQNDSKLPSRICIVDGDAQSSQGLGAYLGDKGIEVCAFSESGAFLTSVDAFRHDFYLIDFDLPGIDGLEMIHLLRRRSEAGIVVVSGRPGDAVLDDALKAGADMFLAKPAPFERTLLAIQAVARRGLATRPPPTWTLNYRTRTLNTPLGVNVALLEADVRLLECFVDTDGAPAWGVTPPSPTRTACTQRSTACADASSVPLKKWFRCSPSRVSATTFAAGSSRPDFDSARLSRAH